MELKEDILSISELLELKRNGMIVVNPEYQRGSVWKETHQKKLIDSVLRGYPLPLIYFHYKKKEIAGMLTEGLEIIDGQQRINALFLFAENAFKLFDPIKDDAVARFPKFISQNPCSWAHCDYLSLEDSLRNKFDETKLFVVKVMTDNEDEVRDLFIRLQAGLPLNAQEKRDAWPGGYTDFVLKFGGKKEIPRYPGHDFFKRFINISKGDRGQIRQLCAQIGMLFFEGANKGKWLDIGTELVDNFYYRNLGFNINSVEVKRFSKILDLAVELFEGYKGPKLKGHEAIHIVLLLDSLLDDYSKGWQNNFISAFDDFRTNSVRSKKSKEGDYWFKYGSLTQTQSSQAKTIQIRHTFFSEKMFFVLKPVRKDILRGYGQLEREIIYFRDNKQCAVCGVPVKWQDIEIHHIEEHHKGGQTTIENGVTVHKDCHPKGEAAVAFNKKWNDKDKL